MWTEFYDRVELHCAKGEAYHDLAGFADKAGEHACRVAALFALISNPSATLIDAETMRGAVKIMEWYLGEAVRLQEWALGAKASSDRYQSKAAAEDQTLRNAGMLRDWLESRPGQTATVREALQFGPNRLRKKRVLLEAAKALYEHRWLEDGYNQRLTLRNLGRTR